MNKEEKYTVIGTKLDNGYYKEVLKIVLDKMYIDENGCWIWIGSTDQNSGYGQVRVYFNRKVSKIFKVHRFIAYCFHGLNLFDLSLDAAHDCDVRNCINPFHIKIMTRSENLYESSIKGRWHSGSYSARGGDINTFVNHLKKKDWGKYNSSSNKQES